MGAFDVNWALTWDFCEFLQMLLCLPAAVMM